MLKFFETTTFILLWTFFFGGCSSFLFFKWHYWRSSKNTEVKSSWGIAPILPALILAPILLVGAFRFFAWNLLFPIHFLTDFHHLLWAAWAPGLVLFMASGFCVSLYQGVDQEIVVWKQKQFYLFAASLGIGVEKQLRRLVVTKCFVQSWSRCLPWIFGELIVVEVVFNAPGLALDVWHLAKVRDMTGLLWSLSSILALFVVSQLVAARLSRWLGGKLESYY